MKKTVIFNVFLCFFVLSASGMQMQQASTITFCQAQEEHFEGIRDIFRTAALDEDDRAKLVVLPEPFQSRSLRKYIRVGRFFVAINNDARQIVSVIKLYHFKSRDELHETIDSELRLASEKGQALIAYGCYHVDTNPERLYRRLILGVAKENLVSSDAESIAGYGNMAIHTMTID